MFYAAHLERESSSILVSDAIEDYLGSKVRAGLSQRHLRDIGGRITGACHPGFRRLRTEEMMRLDWSEVDQVRGYITVSAKKAKTARRRLIPIASSLAQWLRPNAEMSGLLWPKGGRFYHNTINRLLSDIGMTHCARPDCILTA